MLLSELLLSSLLTPCMGITQNAMASYSEESPFKSKPIKLLNRLSIIGLFDDRELIYAQRHNSHECVRLRLTISKSMTYGNIIT
jgi:hypothetical protein